nr:hypothetical protein CFP56_44483 [Quercus suber]
MVTRTSSGSQRRGKATAYFFTQRVLRMITYWKNVYEINEVIEGRARLTVRLNITVNRTTSELVAMPMPRTRKLMEEKTPKRLPLLPSGSADGIASEAFSRQRPIDRLLVYLPVLTIILHAVP